MCQNGKLFQSPAPPHQPKLPKQKTVCVPAMLKWKTVSNHKGANTETCFGYSVQRLQPYNVLFSITLDFVIPNSSNHCTCQCIFIMYSYVHIMFCFCMHQNFVCHTKRMASVSSLPPSTSQMKLCCVAAIDHTKNQHCVAAVVQSAHAC